MSPEQFHVLVVSDDSALRQAICKSLRATGFVPEESSGGGEAIEKVRRRPYDLVLLDLNLPESGGVETCRKLRELSPRMGIVMVRAGGTAEDEVPALEAGANDCVAAPFRFREIVARLGAVLRRSPVENPQRTTVLRAGKLEVDIERRLCWRSGAKIHLSPKEFDLLVVLMKNEEVVLTHMKLLYAVWGPGSHRDAIHLRSCVKALRKKVEDDTANPEYILTEPWVGYLFHNPERSGPRAGR